LLIPAFCTTHVAAQTGPAAPPKIVLSVTAFDITANQPIAKGQTVRAGHQFAVTVTTNGIDCAGQFVVSARGAAGGVPAVLVQAIPYVIGPASGTNSASGPGLTASVLSSGKNDFKISASCNGGANSQFGFGSFEFRASTQ
jgi:hypothetical protein